MPSNHERPQSTLSPVALMLCLSIGLGIAAVACSDAPVGGEDHDTGGADVSASDGVGDATANEDGGEDEGSADLEVTPAGDVSDSDAIGPGDVGPGEVGDPTEDSGDDVDPADTSAELGEVDRVVERDADAEAGPDGLVDGVDGADLGGSIDLTEAVFAPERLLEIEITMAPEDWDELRFQTRSWSMFMEEDCQAEPFESPFTYFPATVSIDGTVIESVGVRKKGFLGSLSDVRPSLKIKLDEYVEGQEYSGMDRFTFNNGQQDQAVIRQCIAYQFFADAGLPAPRCNYAHIVVNGEDLGIYAHVESIKKPFLRRHFSSDEGNLYEGTVSDFRAGWTGTFQKKTNEEEDDWSDIDELVAALELDDEALLEALEPLVDIEAFITFWAVEVIIGHWDGYAGNTNNYWFYHDPGSGRFVFLPWGLDAIFDSQEPFGPSAPLSVVANGYLAQRLYLHPETQAQYLERVAELLDTVWDTDALLDEIDRMEALVAPYSEVNHGASPAAAIEYLREVVRTRRSFMLAELAGPPPTWDVPLRDDICMDDVGSVSVSFDTTWGTLEAKDPFVVGDVDMALNWMGDELTFVSTGATAGNGGAEAGDLGILTVLGWTDEGYIMYVYVGFPEEQVTPGARIPIDFQGAFGTVGYLGPLSGWVPADIGWLLGAELVVEEAGVLDGARFSGQLDAVIYGW